MLSEGGETKYIDKKGEKHNDVVGKQCCRYLLIPNKVGAHSVFGLPLFIPYPFLNNNEE